MAQRVTGSLELALTSPRRQLHAQPHPALRQETRTERNKAWRVFEPLFVDEALLRLFGMDRALST